MSITHLSQLEQQVAALRMHDVPSIQLIDALNDLAQALSRIDVERAIKVTNEAHTAAYLLRHHTGVVTSLVRLSWLHLEEGTFDTAVIEAHQALFMAEQLGDYVLTTRAIFVLATAQHMAGHYAKAEAHWQHLLGLARATGDLGRQASFLNSLGMLFEDQRMFDRALRHYKQAHDLFVKLGDDDYILTKNNMAVILTARGDYANALALVEQALQMCEPEWHLWRALFLHTLGVVHMHLERYDLARREFDKSLAISLSPTGRKETAVDVLLDRARLELVQNRKAAAYDALEQVIELAAEIKSVPQQIEAHKILCRLYAAARDQTTADHHHDVYLALKNQIALQRIERHVGLMRAEAAAAKQQPEWQQESQRY